MFDGHTSYFIPYLQHTTNSKRNEVMSQQPAVPTNYNLESKMCTVYSNERCGFACIKSEPEKVLRLS